ncbi:TetR/AcrR family transcriptional regulator [Bradyrhizobium sp. CCBAU 53338]|uniref:TetR/AcrR family transcriptional regulator n=1 Tax=Bradyrhizobium sp. CCBAU 53338 TaxID=1325111 RepID=UPI00188B3E1C|nr:TetR/AcrR family transcriptional regulator [Bradyrhizobium sp. CCBAU 53338]QOZ51502.1 TetR/AcrR family transcriptional regulator [Bradyrhizobium sp. CCBAU 53338]
MRKPLTDEEIEAFRERLVRVAEKLFAAHGVDGVTMRQIAKALGYSQTAAYRYFADKDEILAAVRAAALRRFCSRLETALKPGRDARENAKAVGRAYLQFALDDPDSYRLIFGSKAPERDIPEYSRTVHRFNSSMTDYVRDLVNQGYLKGDPVELGRAFWVAAHGIVMMHLSGFLNSVRARDELHKMVMQLIYRGARIEVEPNSGGKRASRASKTVVRTTARTRS